MGGGSTNSKPPGSIIMIGQSDTRISSRIILITRFSSRCTALLRLLPALANSANIAKAKLFSPAKLPGFNFLHPIAGYSLILLLPFKAHASHCLPMERVLHDLWTLEIVPLCIWNCPFSTIGHKKTQTWHFIFKNSRHGMGLIKTIMEEYSGGTWTKI